MITIGRTCVMSSFMVLVEGVVGGKGAVSLGLCVDDGAVCFFLSFADAAKLVSEKHSNIHIMPMDMLTIALLMIVENILSLVLIVFSPF